MTPQAHADHLLHVWQSRRHLKPIYRLTDVPKESGREEPRAKETA